ncbi:MAG TPA: four helix bundle protein [Gemmatimonadales bacterium]|nr:four helix bundle protein [Gemmatimonadales bacterium]
MANHKTLKAWVEAKSVSRGVLRASRHHWKPWAQAAFAQLQRASLSVQLNIAEGWTFGRSATRKRHLEIAYGSAMETADLIELMAEEKILEGKVAGYLKIHSANSIRLLVGLLKQVRPVS